MFQLVDSAEQIGPHLYDLTFQDGSKKQIKLVWAKTQPILQIILGFGEDVKASLLALIDGDKTAAIEAIIHTLSRDMVNTFFLEANRIACIALDEYDEKGKLMRVGDTTLMEPEDVFTVMSAVLMDINSLLKNVLGPSLMKTEEE
jgi:hypothetical protein